jgi:type I restriction enzyme M protein
MVELLAPRAEDQICDPACGTCGLLVATGDYLHQKKPAHAYDFSTMLHGRDINDTMLRVGCMNLLINDIDGADIRHMNSLGREQTEEDGKYTVVLASPPFSGTMDLKSVSRALQASIDTRRTELLFMARVLQLLKTGGRAAVIVPDELLSSSAAPHKEMRRRLVDEQKLDGVVMLPSRLFHPFYSEAAAILLFTKTNAGGTDQVWFYDLLADGWSLDVRRQHLLPCSKLGACSSLSAHEHAKNNLPDVITRWRAKNGAEKSRTRADQSFCVPHADIVAKAYDLSLKSYIDVPPVRSPVREATEILSSLARLEDQIIRGIKGLKVIFK